MNLKREQAGVGEGRKAWPKRVRVKPPRWAWHLGVLGVGGLFSCSPASANHEPKQLLPAGESKRSRPEEQQRREVPVEDDVALRGEPVRIEPEEPGTASTAVCPEGMAHIQHSFCEEMSRRCLKSEYEPSNRLTICHRFAQGEASCVGERRELNYCIDRYEHPNQPGASPPVMIDFYQAEKLCEAQGKRLCYESEWVAACEGPDESPFPYGWERSKSACNIDNPWISPSLSKLHSQSVEVRSAELERLNQGKPSGAMEGCQSGYGVYDMTGNLDEWAYADPARTQRTGKRAVLKGGAWGHVRNACRPVTTSHSPGFRYYSVSTRCCADVSRETK